MVTVFAIMAALWGFGAVIKTAYTPRLVMIALVYGVVVLGHFVLPEGHPLRIATGETAAPWLILGGAVLLVLAYRAGLNRLRRVAQPMITPAPRQSGTFTPEELERYARHITLPDIGGQGQKALKSAKVLVVGAGGLGSPVLLYLAAAGVGRIGVIDADHVSLSNLQRQIIHRDADQDMPKVFSAERAMKAINPHLDIRPYNRALDETIAAELFADYDLIIDGTDQFETRAMINRAAVSAKRPLLAGAISAWEGQITLYDPSAGGACMACVFPNPPQAGMAATCAETGVIGALPGVVGTMMALEAIKQITGAGQGLLGRMLLYDGLGPETRIVKLKRNAACPVCAGD
jgi:molybdopterin/thiamine biosynthesis adenylyltransferase